MIALTSLILAISPTATQIPNCVFTGKVVFPNNLVTMELQCGEKPGYAVIDFSSEKTTSASSLRIQLDSKQTKWLTTKVVPSQSGNLIVLGRDFLKSTSFAIQLGERKFSFGRTSNFGSNDPSLTHDFSSTVTYKGQEYSFGPLLLCPLMDRTPKFSSLLYTDQWYATVEKEQLLFSQNADLAQPVFGSQVFDADDLFFDSTKRAIHYTGTKRQLLLDLYLFTGHLFRINNSEIQWCNRNWKEGDRALDEIKFDEAPLVSVGTVPVSTIQESWKTHRLSALPLLKGVKYIEVRVDGGKVERIHIRRPHAYRTVDRAARH